LLYEEIKLGGENSLDLGHGTIKGRDGVRRRGRYGKRKKNHTMRRFFQRLLEQSTSETKGKGEKAEQFGYSRKIGVSGKGSQETRRPDLGSGRELEKEIDVRVPGGKSMITEGINSERTTLQGGEEDGDY